MAAVTPTDTLARPVIEDPDVLVMPTPEMKSASAEVVHLLEAAEGENVQLRGAYEGVDLPHALAAAIRRLCRYFADGLAVTIVPYQAELTTQAAANLLGISRTRLIQLIDRGDLHARREGTHRRLLLEEVLGLRAARALRQDAARSRMNDVAASTVGGELELEQARRRAAESSMLQ
jgi:excisionase family DNA binding protein